MNFDGRNEMWVAVHPSFLSLLDALFSLRISSSDGFCFLVSEFWRKNADGFCFWVSEFWRENAVILEFGYASDTQFSQAKFFFIV
jgi:hypothetical protein